MELIPFGVQTLNWDYRYSANKFKFTFEGRNRRLTYNMHSKAMLHLLLQHQ